MPSIFGRRDDDAPPPSPPPDGYERHKARQAKRQAAASASGRDIGPIPPVGDPARRERGRSDFRAFCETYLAGRFALAWGQPHLEAIRLMQLAVLDGLRFALAMPRGYGKTSLAEAAAIWAHCYGHRRFTVMIGSDKEAAESLIGSIAGELDDNEPLAEDFPEICYPIRALEGIRNRAAGQTCQGKRTRIVWTDNKLVLPTVEGSAASGGVLLARGLLGRIRGIKHRLATGEIIRPDFVIPDDPQTDDSAASPSQNAKRTRVLNGAVLGLAGPTTQIAGVCPCTVIVPDDMADTLLDHDKSPDWHGQRTKALAAMPDDLDAWNDYREVWKRGHQALDAGKAANRYYAAHRERLDAGAEHTWEPRIKPPNLSAIQTAMEEWCRDPAAFAAELQNEPLALDELPEDALDVDELTAKIGGFGRGVVPPWCSRVVAMIDVQKKLLYYAVAALADGLGGQIIDYGTWPEQPGTRHFTYRQAKHTLGRKFPKLGDEARIIAGLDALLGDLIPRRWQIDGGGDLEIGIALIDAGYKADAVYRAVAESEFRGRLRPMHGRGIGAAQVPMIDWQTKPGEVVGHHWRERVSAGRGRQRYIIADANTWKGIRNARLRQPRGDGDGRGCLTLYRPGDRDPNHHRLIAEHLAAEYAIPVNARGRTVDEFQLRPNREEHLADCVYGCLVAGSAIGVKADDQPQTKTQRRRRRRGGVRYAS